MAIEKVGPGGVGNSYGARDTASRTRYDLNKDYTEEYTDVDGKIVTAKTQTGGVKSISAGGAVIPVPLGLQTLSVGVMGDSISNQCFDLSTGYGAVAGDAALSSYGWVTWWQYFSCAALSFTNYAVPGSTTQGLRDSQLAAALAGNHDIYTIAPNGINDAVAGSVSVANITYVVDTLVAAGKRVLLGTPTPNGSFSTSKSRIATIAAGMRALAIKYPAQVRLVDFARLASNPSDADGANYLTYFDAMTYDVDTAATHPNWVAAASFGYAAHKATTDWTSPYTYPVTRGDANNMLPNGQFGGVGGTITSGGANSVGPDTWVTSRGAATVTYSAFKARRLPLMWKTAVTYPVGARITPPVPNGYHYIVLTSAASGATAPSSLVSFAQTQPDAGGPVYLTVPANDSNDVPEVGEDLLILASSTAMTASDYVGITNAAIDATAMVGKKIKVGLYAESIGSIPALVQLRVEQYAGASRIVGAFGMMANSLPGTTKAAYSAIANRKRGLVATPSFIVDPTCTQLRIYIRTYTPSNGYQTAMLLSDGFAVEVQ